MGNLLENKKLIIFDFDGLLVNTEEIYLRGWEKALIHYNLTISSHVLSSFKGKSIDYVNSILLSKGLTLEIINKLRYYRETIILESLDCAEIKVLPGVIEFLEFISQKYMVVMCTSSPRKRVNKIIDYLAIAKYFDGKITYEDTLYHKPDPQPYKHILTNYGVSPFEAIAFEDSISGLLSAQRNGIDVHYVNSLINDEIYEICKSEWCHRSFIDVIKLV